MEILLFAIILLLLDIPFLTLYMKGRYQVLFNKNNIALNVNMVYAFITYIIMALAWVIINQPGLTNTEIIKRAMITGFVIYGVYSFTLASLLPHYDIYYALTETLWGTVLYTLATVILLKLFKKI